LPLLLVGQPELGVRLEDSSLRQLKQRVALRCEVIPFELQETAGYIASRIRTAGGVATRLFTRTAVILIHEYSKGVPRTISVICDNALTHALALGRQPVDRQMVLEVCRDFHLDGGAASRAPYEPESFESEPESAPEPELAGASRSGFRLFSSYRR
jgi:general secretion pathway protein A